MEEQAGRALTADERTVSTPRVGAIALLALLSIASILTMMTARECHLNLRLHHIFTSFYPSLLFGFVSWFSWVGVAVVVWQVGVRRPGFLDLSGKGILLHVGIGCLVTVLHLALVQLTIWWDATTWPVWGHAYAALRMDNLARFGIDLVVYGFLYGFSASFYAQYQTQRTLVEKLAVEHQKLEVERRLTQAQLKAVQMQMEPHFLFNTLNAITSLIAQKRNPEAMDTLDDLNTILRTTLSRRAPEKVPFTEELRVVESYLAIQKVRFADRLQVKIEASPEAMDGLVPCFLLQPIVENAIQHGISPMEKGGLIETCVKRVGDRLWMQVRDNGSGLSDPSTKGHGIGMQNVRDRLAYFYPDAYEFVAAPRDTGGYEVTIQIPYERAMA